MQLNCINIEFIGFVVLSQVFYMGLVIYTPATALEAVTGFTIWGSIVATGVVVTIYTALVNSFKSLNICLKFSFVLYLIYNL